MSTDRIAWLNQLLDSQEGEQLEFKEARGEESVPDPLRARLRRLIDLGVVESIGRGRGTRYLLARRFYSTTGRAGVYTRRKGLDREQNKALLLKHIRSRSPQGCAMAELQQVLPAL